MDSTTILILIALAWLALRVRGLETRATIAEARVVVAEGRAGTAEAGRVVAELRAVALEVELWRVRRVGAELRSVFIADVSPVLQRAHVQSDRLPGLLADVAGETHGVRDS